VIFYQKNFVEVIPKALYLIPFEKKSSFTQLESNFISFCHRSVTKPGAKLAIISTFFKVVHFLNNHFNLFNYRHLRN
jgi:hypothetical protein